MAFAMARSSLTRQSALETARILYRDLAESVQRDQLADAQFVEELAGDWAARLASLSTFRSDAALPEDTQEAFDALCREVLDPVDDDARLRWLDLFPEVVTRLFASPTATFRWTVASEEPQVRDNWLSPVA